MVVAARIMGMTKQPKPTAQITEEGYFRDASARFTGLTKHAILISNKIGRHVASHPAGLASWLFLRACVTSKSIEALLIPIDHGFGGSYLDHGSIASLCRGLIENVAVMRYIGDIDISEDEWKCRHYIIQIHDAQNRIEFLDLMGIPAKGAARSMVILEKKLRDNAFFQTLPARRQKRLIGGDDMFVGGRHEAMLVFGWGDDLTRAVYKYLSQQSHSLSMSFQRTEINRVYEGDSPYAKMVAGYSLTFAGRALGFGFLHAIKLFPFIESSFDPTVLAALRTEYMAGE